MVYYAANDKNNPVIVPDDAKPIGEGNEGKVYNIGGVAVKIINSTSWMDEYKLDYLSSLVSPKLILMPIQGIYDENGNYSGYIMKLLDCVKGEDAELNLMHCDDLIKSIKFIKSDAKLLSEQKVAMKDTKLRNAVINNRTNLINMIDPDRYLTPYSFNCHFTEIEEFKKENDYWVNKLFESLFKRMIDQSADGFNNRKFRFYMREEIESVMDRGHVPEFIAGEVNGFDTVQDYMDHKHQYVKSKGLLNRF